MKLFYNLITLFVLMSTSLHAKTYYVSCKGSDANKGTSPELAWASIEKVNSARLDPGDKILFQGGCSFEGSIFFGVEVKGTAEMPIQLGSYGSGRAIISSGSSYGLKIYNTSGFKVFNIIFKGAGRTDNNASGIDVYMDLADTRLSYILIDSVEVSGYHKPGISIGSWKGASGFDDVTITNSLVHDNGDAGISSFAEAVLGHRNMYVAYNKVYNNAGLPEKTNLHSGNGIVLGGVDGATIEYCEAYNNGWLNAWRDGGPVGIWGWHCNNLVIQYNESHHNKTGTGKDGGGFDLDGGCTNCVMQYNYSHDNEGPGYLIAQYFYAPPMKGIVVRYNISENDARKNGYGAIHLWSSGSNGGIQDAEIYNNTIYLEDSQEKAPRAVFIQSGGVKNVRFYNNIFQAADGLELIYVDKLTDVRFEGNNYWSGGESLKVNWGGKIHSTLESWREASGQEISQGKPTGYLFNPELESPGGGLTLSGPGAAFMLNGYELKKTSALIGKGLKLWEDYGIAIGEKDFWGNSLEQREDICIGAHQFTEHTKICLYGGEVELLFGQVAGGDYSGNGVVNGRFFDPELVGAGKHPVWYAYTDEAGMHRKMPHTITVMEASATEWLGEADLENSWFSSQNWSTCVPTSLIDVFIPVVDGNGAGVVPVIEQERIARGKDLQGPESFFKGEGTIEIHGKLTNNVVQAPQNSSVVFRGGDEQFIPGGHYSSLLLMGAGKKRLAGSVVVGERMVLEETSLFLGNQDLRIGPGGMIENASSSAYIVTDGSGKLTMEGLGEEKEVVFPVGSAKSFNPLAFHNRGIDDDFSVRVGEGIEFAAYAALDQIPGVVNKIWYIEEKVRGGSDVQLEFQWNLEDESPEFNRSESMLLGMGDEAGMYLRKFFGSLSDGREEGTYMLKLDSIRSFMPFVVGMREEKVVPESPFQFTLKLESGEIILNWEAVIEKEKKRYEVQLSLDKKYFRALGVVEGTAGSFPVLHQFRFVDFINGNPEKRYYRLQQMDSDGKDVYSEIKELVMFGEEFVGMEVSPNPAQNKINVKVNALQDGEFSLSIVDVQGKLIMKKRVAMVEGINHLRVDLEENKLPAGLYLLTVEMGQNMYQQKIIKK